MSSSFVRKRLSGLLVAGMGAAGLVTSACAHNNGARVATIRIASSEQDVAGCERVTGVRVQGASSRAQAQAELEKLTQDRGGNVLLLPSSGDGTSGTAYKCSGVPAAAS